MSFGYEVLVSPLQTLMLYNAIANNGKMVKPYLVNAINRNGLVVKNFEPLVLEENVCSERTLKSLQSALEGVCNEEGGTGYNLFKGSFFKVAGKTGTALVANGKRGYADHIYQSSFAGYFPANDPKYSCIVVIRNKPFARKFYGASVAGPVFKEIAEKLVSLDADKLEPTERNSIRPDSVGYYYAGAYDEMKNVMKEMKFSYKDSAGKSDWAKMYAVNYAPVLNSKEVVNNHMPDLRGMKLKDALYLLEDMGLKVAVTGKGKVAMQSLLPGTPINKKQLVTIQLN